MKKILYYPILQVWKLQLRESKHPAQGHVASKWGEFFKNGFIIFRNKEKQPYVKEVTNTKRPKPEII